MGNKPAKQITQGNRGQREQSLEPSHMQNKQVEQERERASLMLATKKKNTYPFLLVEKLGPWANLGVKGHILRKKGLLS